MNTNLREIALDIASRNSEHELTADLIVARAETYFEFLRKSDPRVTLLLEALLKISSGLLDQQSNIRASSMVDIANEAIAKLPLV